MKRVILLLIFLLCATSLGKHCYLEIPNASKYRQKGSDIPSGCIKIEFEQFNDKVYFSVPGYKKIDKDLENKIKESLALVNEFEVSTRKIKEELNKQERLLGNTHKGATAVKIGSFLVDAGSELGGVLAAAYFNKSGLAKNAKTKLSAAARKKAEKRAMKAVKKKLKNILEDAVKGNAPNFKTNLQAIASIKKMYTDIFATNIYSMYQKALFMQTVFDKYYNDQLISSSDVKTFKEYYESNYVFSLPSIIYYQKLIGSPSLVQTIKQGVLKFLDGFSGKEVSNAVGLVEGILNQEEFNTEFKLFFTEIDTYQQIFLKDHSSITSNQYAHIQKNNRNNKIVTLKFNSVECGDNCSFYATINGKKRYYKFSSKISNKKYEDLNSGKLNGRWMKVWITLEPESYWSPMDGFVVDKNNLVESIKDWELILTKDVSKKKAKPKVSTTVSHKIDKINLGKLVPKYELKDFSKYDVKLLRNKIFAQKGYVFKTPKIQQFFEGFRWYADTRKLTDNNKIHEYLSSTDKKNIKLLKEYEKHYAMYKEWWKIIAHLEGGNKKEVAKYFVFPFKDWSETWSEKEGRSVTNRFSCKSKAEFYSKYNLLFSKEDIKALKKATFDTHDNYKDPEEHPSGVFVAPNEYCIRAGEKLFSLTLKSGTLKFSHIPYRP